MERSTDIKIKCYKCGNEYLMENMRMGPNGKNLTCRNCLERKPMQAHKPDSAVKTIEGAKTEKPESKDFKEYFCKECRYSFKRAKHIGIASCSYCGSSSSLNVKGSVAKILADVAKMKRED